MQPISPTSRSQAVILEEAPSCWDPLIQGISSIATSIFSFFSWIFSSCYSFIQRKTPEEMMHLVNERSGVCQTFARHLAQIQETKAYEIISNNDPSFNDLISAFTVTFESLQTISDLYDENSHLPNAVIDLIDETIPKINESIQIIAEMLKEDLQGTSIKEELPDYDHMVDYWNREIIIPG